MKNFVKAMNKEGAGFRYMRQMFPRISDAKVKEGIFVGPVHSAGKEASFSLQSHEVQHVAQDSFSAFTPGLFPYKSWCSQ